MKKFLIGIVAFSALSTAFAAHGPAGCGFGALMFKGQDGMVMHVLAATFNGSSGSQTFGMSTGTLGCEDAKTAKVSAVPFIEGNHVALANDIAQGDGETLRAYLSLVGKENANKETLKANFDEIFAANDAGSIHAKINELI